MLTRRLLIIAAVTACLVTQGDAQDKSIVVASTTSTQDSGLFGYLLPIFIQKTGIAVKVVARVQARHSTPHGAVTLTWYSCMLNRLNSNFCPRVSA
jgi:ABC-type tungstate transport system permease subunit